MNEHTCARKLTKALREAGAYVWKINANFANGVPDFWIAGDHADLWLELKWEPRLPIRDTTLVTPALSTLQRVWLKDRTLQGVRVRVVLATHDGWIVYNNTEEWEKGITARAARERAQSFRDAVIGLCRHIGIPEVRHGSPDQEPPDSRAGGNRRKAQSPVVAAQRSLRPDAGESGRNAGNHARRVHAVPEQPHCDQHGLRARDVQAARGGPL